MKKVFALSLAVLFVLAPAVSLAKGGGGGGHASSGGHSSFSSSRSSSTSSRSSSTTSKSAPAPAPRPVAPKVATKPSSSTAKVTASKPVAKGYSSTGYKVGSGYSPRFQGYTAPPGSVVYYRQSSAMDWLPWYFLLTHNSHQQATVVQPDGQKKTVQAQGVDTMYVVNWILMIVLTLGIIGLIVWLVDRHFKKKAAYART